MTPRPPAIARALLRLLLPASVEEIIAGDLEEAWTARPAPLTYLRLTVASIVAWWLHRLRGAAPPHDQPDELSTGSHMIRHVIQDAAYGIRLMRRSPGFSAAVIATLALGIGANAATFSIVDVLMLKPLNYRQPERVAFVLGWSAARQQRLFNLPLADAVDLGRQTSSFDAVAEYSYWSANLTGAAAPERIQAYRVTANTFELLGAQPLAGRMLSAGDGRPDAADVVVLSHGLWQRRFGGVTSIVGQTITLDGRPHTVVGIMPPRFEFPVFNFKGEMWTPLKIQLENGAGRAGSPSIVAIARLKDGVTYARAQAELDAIMRRLEADYPQTNRGLGARVIEMRRLGSQEGAPVIAILMCAVGFVLLLACANVANLMLSRAVARERELSVRAALGAGRGRIVRQLLTESALFSVAGAAAGLVIASWALHALRASLPEILLTTVPNVMDLGVDRATLGFTAGVAIVAALLFGAAPALRTARADLTNSLKSGGHGTAGAGPHRLRAALMIGEVAMALVVLVGAGLLVRTFDRLQRIDPGFNADPVLTLTVSLPEYRYADASSQRRFFERSIERISSLGSVRSAAWVNVLPFSTYNRGTRFVVDGSLPEAGREPAADYRAITADYFRTLGIPVLAGRSFDSRDSENGQPVAIVNRTLAARELPGVDPIGRRLRLGRRDSTPRWMTVVGVVGDVLHSEVTGRPASEIYVPTAQAPGSMMMLAARTIYGVISYAVNQQTREIGVRLALGAAPSDVLRLVVGPGMVLILIGTAIGAAIALGGARIMQGVLYGVTPADAATYASVSTLLILVGACACYVPARRVLRLDPVVVLRTE